LRLNVIPAAGALLATLFAGLLAAPSPAGAELVLSQLVVELAPGRQDRADIEVLNRSPERSFVTIEPREIVAPGTSGESSRTDPDPEKLGILVSPERMVLEPGEQRLMRIASLAPGDRERIYRVRVEPVMGKLSSPSSGLKILVGYDVLVLVRPSELRPHVSGSRSGNALRLVNDGNVSVELLGGRACDSSMRNCRDLPGGRLYAGASRSVLVDGAAKVQYELKAGAKFIPVQF
jgi:P pilus assembly chaperone PapD